MSEEQAQQLLYHMQVLENHLSELSSREMTLVNIIREAGAAIESIKGLGAQTESETLVPMGIGTFVKAKLLPNEKFVVNVGAGASLEKDKDSVLNYLESRMKELEVALRETTAKKQEVMANLEQGKQEMNRLVAESKSKKQ